MPGSFDFLVSPLWMASVSSERARHSGALVMYSSTFPLTVTILIRRWVTVVLWFTKAMNFLKGLQQEWRRAGDNGPWCLFLFLALHLSFGLWMSQKSWLYMFRSYSACIYLTFSPFFLVSLSASPGLILFYLWTAWTAVLFFFSPTFYHSPVLYFMTYGGKGHWDVEMGCLFTFGWTWTRMDLGVQQSVTVGRQWKNPWWEFDRKTSCWIVVDCRYLVETL